jgi:hypothetical protein
MALSTLSQFESTHATAVVPTLVRIWACHSACSLGRPNLRSRLSMLITSPPARSFARRALRSALSIVSDSQALLSWPLFVLLKQTTVVNFGSQCSAVAVRSLLRIQMGILLLVAEHMPSQLPATLFAKGEPHVQNPDAPLQINSYATAQRSFAGQEVSKTASKGAQNGASCTV